MTKKDKQYLGFFAGFAVFATLILSFIFVKYFESIMFGAATIIFGVVSAMVLIYFNVSTKTITEEEALQNTLDWYINNGYTLIPDAIVKVIEVSRKVPTYHYPLLGSATVNGEKAVPDHLFKITSSTINCEFLLSDAKIKSGESYPQTNDEVKTDSRTRILVKIYDGKKFVFTY